jgi:hypothetical protein
MMRFLRFLLIVLATSLVWVWIFDKMIEEGYVTLNEVPTEQVQEEPAPVPVSTPAPKTKQSAQTVAETTAFTQPTEPVAVALAEGIIGEWIPVEIADENVVFSKYGTCKQGKYGTDYVYKISGDKVLLYYDVNIPVVAESMTAKVTSQSGIYYLEIYNNGEFGGKYRRK